MKSEGIYAFDIDGALTEPEGLEKFHQLQNRSGVTIGIVTARTKRSAQDFVDETNLDPDFVSSTPLKGKSLRLIARREGIERESERIYYGSWVRDRVHAKLAGWQYEQI